MGSKPFARALAFVLREEGGYTNDRYDSGGPTQCGIIQRVYDGYRKNRGLPCHSVRRITREEIRAIYRAHYWNAICGDALPAGLDLLVFDGAVNSGPVQSVKWLQRAVNMSAVDGHMGAATLAAVRSAPHASVIQSYCVHRRAMLRRLRNFWRFGRGWLARVDRLERACLALVTQGKGAVLPSGEEPKALPKANPAHIALEKTAEVKAGAGAAASTLGVAVAEAAEKVQPLAEFGSALKWVFVALTLASIALLLWVALKRARAGAV